MRRAPVCGHMSLPTLRMGDLTVGRLGLGTNRLQTLSPDDATRLLARAVELGVTMVDTADLYGDHESEKRIGHALRHLAARPVVATKGGMLRHDPGVDGSRSHLRAALRGSLERLGLARVDLYYLHKPDPRVPVAESVRTLAELRDEGLVRHIGLCNVDLAQLEEARRVAPIAAVQNRYHLGDRGSEEVLRACERHGIAFVPWYPLGKNTDLLAPGGVVAKVAQGAGATPQQVALAWLLQRSPAMLPIPGTTRVAHLEENARAAAVRLSAEDVRALDGIAPPARA